VTKNHDLSDHDQARLGARAPRKKKPSRDDGVMTADECDHVTSFPCTVCFDSSINLFGTDDSALPRQLLLNLLQRLAPGLGHAQKRVRYGGEQQQRVDVEDVFLSDQVDQGLVGRRRNEGEDSGDDAGETAGHALDVRREDLAE